MIRESRPVDLIDRRQFPMLKNLLVVIGESADSGQDVHVFVGAGYVPGLYEMIPKAPAQLGCAQPKVGIDMDAIEHARSELTTHSDVEVFERALFSFKNRNQ